LGIGEHGVGEQHRDLRELTEKGSFHSDLYFRINMLHLRIPPLRERREDILIIADKLVEQLAHDMKRGPVEISENARAALGSYTWPGNIRELRNVLERAVLLSDDGVIYHTGLEFEGLSERAPAANSEFDNLTLREIEKHFILKAPAAEVGNVICASRRLGIHRSSLYAKLREYDR
jgi:DNA-binding NtrC family response regulator